MTIAIVMKTLHIKNKGTMTVIMMINLFILRTKDMPKERTKARTTTELVIRNTMLT
jgi:hypothetical protein